MMEEQSIMPDRGEIVATAKEQPQEQGRNVSTPISKKTSHVLYCLTDWRFVERGKKQKALLLYWNKVRGIRYSSWAPFFV